MPSYGGALNGCLDRTWNVLKSIMNTAENKRLPQTSGHIIPETGT